LYQNRHRKESFLGNFIFFGELSDLLILFFFINHKSSKAHEMSLLIEFLVTIQPEGLVSGLLTQTPLDAKFASSR